jgi:hypothetical protein
MPAYRDPYDSGAMTPLGVGQRVDVTAVRKRPGVGKDVAIGVGIACVVLGVFAIVKFAVLGGGGGSSASGSGAAAAAASTGALVVTVADDKPAEVWVNGARRGVVERGTFKMEKLEAGSYAVKVKREGVKDCEQKVQVEGSGLGMVRCEFAAAAANVPAPAPVPVPAPVPPPPAPSTGSGSAGSSPSPTTSPTTSTSPSTSTSTSTPTTTTTTATTPTTTATTPTTTATTPVKPTTTTATVPATTVAAVGSGSGSAKVEAEKPKPKVDKPKPKNDAAKVEAPKPATDVKPTEVKPEVKPTTVAVADEGYLVAYTTPFARVVVDGSDTGKATPIGPRAKIHLKPGKHKVKFVVGDQSEAYTINIEAGKTTTLTKDLQIGQ